MVLMPRPYKDDKEIEEELREKRRLILKPSCTFATKQKKSRQSGSIDYVTDKLVDRVALQEIQIKYLLDLITNLGFVTKIEDPKIVVIQEISKEDGKTLVENYFKEHETADIEELMLNLRIPIQVIVEIIDELRDEGKLVPQGETE